MTITPKAASAKTTSGQTPDAPADEPRHALRVDEDLPDLQPRHERRRHPRALALEELDQVQVGADGDDQLGALLVREQQREVLADPRRGDPLVGQAESLEPRGAGRVPVRRVRVDDQLGAGAERLVGDRVHVADDHVRPQPELEQRVGAAVDRHEHRLEVADVAADDRQVALHPGAARDDERVTVAEARVERREVDAAGEDGPSSRR